MSGTEDLLDDVQFLLKRLSYLDGNDLRFLCEDLELPILNMGSSKMVRQIQARLLQARESCGRAPYKESEAVMIRFRYDMLLKSGFLERYLNLVKKSADLDEG